MQAFDVVVIGAGSGGLTAARRLALAGKHTALIERDLVGGDCLNWGCIPTKTLVALAASYYQLKQHRSSHPDLADTFPDFLAMKNRITTVQAEVGTDERRYYIDDPGVHLLHGTAHFLDTHTIRVNDQEIRFNHCIIATGSRPRIPSIPGLAATSYHTNETIFQLDRIPSSLAIIGGGPIGCEFAQAFQRLGCHVTIVEQNDRLLVREDPEASEVLLQAFREEGITIYLDTHIQATERQSDQQQLLHLLSHNWQAVVAINAILVAAGRQANIESLNLLAAGVQTNEHGIIVDTRLRTTAPHIWAVGDVTGGLFFTHVAADPARLHTAERCTNVEPLPTVDPHRADAQSLGNALSDDHVTGPRPARQAVLGRVCPSQYLVEIVKLVRDNDRAEHFVLRDAHGIRSTHYQCGL